MQHMSIFSSKLVSLSTRDKVGVRVLMTSTFIEDLTVVLIIIGTHSPAYEHNVGCRHTQNCGASNVNFIGYSAN